MKPHFDFEAALKPYLTDPTFHGVELTRVYMDNTLCNQYKLKPSAREGIQVWCLCVGKVQQPKLFYYGHTIESAFKTFQQEYQKLSGADRASFGLKASLAKKASPKKVK